MIQRRKRITTTNATLAWSGASLLLALGVGACSHKHPDAALPTSTAPDAPNASTSPTSSDSAVRQSYTGYWSALPRAEHAIDEKQRRQLLEKYSIDPQLSKALQGINDLHSKGLTSSGYVVVHIEKVQMANDTATVWDCQDATKALIQKGKTGKAVSRGVPNDHIRATLSQGSDGQWRISKFAPLSHC